jgi:PAS domain-containing protein
VVALYAVAVHDAAAPTRFVDTAHALDLVAPEQRDFVAEKMRQRMAGDSGESRYEVTGIRPDGGRIELELYGNLLIHDNRPAMLGLVIDITARKRAERELQRHNEELDRINRAMVGREVVMIEMKREINRLSQQLGYQTPYDLAFLDESETPASGPGA